MNNITLRPSAEVPAVIADSMSRYDYIGIYPSAPYLEHARMHHQVCTDHHIYNRSHSGRRQIRTYGAYVHELNLKTNKARHSIWYRDVTVSSKTP